MICFQEVIFFLSISLTGVAEQFMNAQNALVHETQSLANTDGNRSFLPLYLAINEKNAFG